MKNDLPGMPLVKSQIRYEQDVVTARQKTRLLSQLLGFDNQDQVRIATAVSELARNAYQYAGGGSVEYFLEGVDPQALVIRVSDAGPGIPNLEEVLSGTGRGVLGSKKLMDFFHVTTSAGQGTQMTMGKTLPVRGRLIKMSDLPAIAEKLASRQPGSPLEEVQNQNRELLKTLEALRTSQDELAELNRELNETNRGVVALYAELDEKAASLQRANEVKTSFLSNMTHEFRTPLSSVISLTRLLLDRVDGELTVEQERQVNYIRQSSESLLELVNDLLDLAKVEAGKVSVNTSEFRVDEIFGALRGMFRPILNAEQAVELKIADARHLPEFSTDQAKVSQILRNLVSNALKFTERGSVTVSASAGDGGLIHFMVKDTGIGIDPESLQFIFNDFSQVDSKLQRKNKGTGLGLPLSRKLARLLGGDLWVESRQGDGSTFHVTVPRVYRGEREAVLITGPSSAEQPAPLAAGARFNVLLIDDDEPSRYVLKGLIQSELDVNILEASDGEDGLRQISSLRPDLVFLDLSMPGMDGFTLLERMRERGDELEIPVIVNTAKKMSDDERDFLRRRSIAILSKERTDQQAAVRDLRRALVKAGFDYKGM